MLMHFDFMSVSFSLIFAFVGLKGRSVMVKVGNVQP